MKKLIFTVSIGLIFGAIALMAEEPKGELYKHLNQEREKSSGDLKQNKNQHQYQYQHENENKYMNSDESKSEAKKKKSYKKSMNPDFGNFSGRGGGNRGGGGRR